MVLKRNALFCISGISGSGKTSTMRQVMDNEVVSFTTRKPRQGEIDGVDYIFTTKEEIKILHNTGGLVERVEYRDNIYGITKEEFENKITKNHAFVIVDYHGYQQFKEIYDNVVGIYFSIPIEDAKKRMELRGDGIASIESRLNSIEKEMSNSKYYNFIVENAEGKQEETVELVKRIIKEVTQ